MSLHAHVRYFFNAETYGGVMPEQLLVAVERAPNSNFYSGLVLKFDTDGPPRIHFSPRLEDLDKWGWREMSPTRARLICDAIPGFLDALAPWGERDAMDTMTIIYEAVAFCVGCAVAALVTTWAIYRVVAAIENRQRRRR